MTTFPGTFSDPPLAPPDPDLEARRPHPPSANGAALQPPAPASDPLADAPKVTVLGVTISNVTKRDATRRMEALIAAGAERARAVYIVNAHTLNLACDDPGYRRLLNGGDAVFGDGTGVRWAARMQGVRMADNLVGTDLMPYFFAETLPARYRYFLLGAEPHVVDGAAEHIRRAFPGLTIAGYHHGHFGAEDNAAVMQQINAAAPDLLLVAMGNPTQERWIHDNLGELRARLCIGVGGLFDHWGGALRRAPLWVRRAGFEWAQLMLQQPHKWRRYVVGNPKFLARVARAERSARAQVARTGT